MAVSTAEYLKALKDVNFAEFFKHAVGATYSPYPFQERLALEAWPDLVKVETGMGKTAAVILAWLFKRLQEDPHTPRRLVYCLPMRVLVEQTAENARQWVNNLEASGLFTPENVPSVHVLMGGEITADWDRHPERSTVVIGTQDQLLSRALNRGYAMSRFRWPVQFGLLNNDCLWVMDEIQLMGTGLATTAQLDAFRDFFGTVFPVHSMWMSATLDRSWLNTIDFAGRNESLTEVNLSSGDKGHPSLRKRFEARKPVELADCPADKPKDIAKLILDAHQRGTRTLVVLNTVGRAVAIYNALKRMKPGAEICLVHSRFRAGDRGKALAKALSDPGAEGCICISTQVIEAGVDISATTLVTDLAPWSSLVQRFGRCNRYGLDSNARVIWLRIDTSKKGASLPYSEEELAFSASVLEKLDDVGPQSLPPFSSGVDYIHVLRKKDIVELFDTTPDLSGLDLDISKYIRETDDHDVQVFWRDLEEGVPGPNEPGPSREELCPVPVNDLLKLKTLTPWCWDHLEKKWARPQSISKSISPGMILMLSIDDGCYARELGWTGSPKDIPELLDPSHLAEEADGDDFFTSTGWQTLLDHSDAVTKEMSQILEGCAVNDKAFAETLLTACRWHDAGKAHDVFQRAMVGDPPEAAASVIWGKTGRGNISYERRGFRHELASALVALENGTSDLVAYLIASHHGKVRLSIRSLPHEKSPDDPALRFARGIWEGDTISEVHLGGGQKSPDTVLDLSYMEFGDGPKGQSWLARMLSLRDNESLGPFRLAYMEALLRTADWRASEKAGKTNA